LSISSKRLRDQYAEEGQASARRPKGLRLQPFGPDLNVNCADTKPAYHQTGEFAFAARQQFCF
jgi:hypothetical protein